jgi:hypothetical protein
MKTIELTCGTHIDAAAVRLVQNAPARSEFNGIPIRARYATTCPRDIVREWERRMETLSVIYRNSPAGKRADADRLTDILDAQLKIDICLAALPDLDITDPGAVLSWIVDMAEPSDRVGVTFDKPGLVELFARHGWGANVNCGEDFDGDDARNVAGWIVGQWLHCGYPIVTRFAEQWRAKFGTAPTVNA